MRLTSTFASVASLASLVTAQTGTPQKINAFTLQVYNPGTVLHNQKVEASGLSFNLGLDGPAAYCPVPTVPQEACPPGNQTVVYGGGMQISVVVPGGQQTYVAPSGLISYTQAHSGATPAGSFFGGFTIITFEDRQGKKTLINWKTPDNAAFAGILACPDVPDFSSATYQLYARTPAFNQTSCVEFVGLRQIEQPNNNAGAWQYT